VALAIPRSVVEELLLGRPDARRQLQDTPILGDVWVQFANEPGEAIDLLITPHRTSTANDVALAINDRIDVESNGDPNIAYLQGVVAATLTFREVLRVIVPMTSWWDDPSNQKDLQIYWSGVTGRERLRRSLLSIPGIAKARGARSNTTNPEPSSALDRYIALAGLTLWAGGVTDESPGEDQEFATAIQTVTVDQLAGPLVTLLEDIRQVKPAKPRVFQISLNRTANPAIARSVPSVKGDAARNLFSVNCKDIAWAVIDSGIDRTHPAFNDARNKTRIEKTFDFTQFRRIVSLSNLNKDIRAKNLKALGKKPGGKADRALRELAEDAKAGHRVNWLIVEELITVDPYRPPETDHGTHVAGILGASKTAQVKAKLEESECADGMCPDIKLYDFRVLAKDVRDTEFAIIAALQYIRYLNERHRFVTINGVNLSLSIPHDVRNYACGRTPICMESERLVESGVVVVAAAGNLGFQRFETSEGSYESYAAFSVTDPGNADGVITVGATHRYSPHTYGVSFFSSRGPTGDGRMKPDLVAPGERIRSPVRAKEWADLDGTSMAAPHVSGAAAMLMARYSELIGEPRRIKDILCRSATDLGRERSFQGHGMVDVLRAFQSV
jgi:serine protease AprX